MLRWQLIVCLLKKGFNAYCPVLLKKDMEGGYEKRNRSLGYLNVIRQREIIMTDFQINIYLCIRKCRFAYFTIFNVNRIGTKQIGSIDDCGRHATLPQS